MSFNINKTQQSDTLFNRSGIDTSNWPARHDFLSKLPSDIENWNEEHWIGILIPSVQQGGQKDHFINEYHKFENIRNRLSNLNLLGEYDAQSIPENEWKKRLKDLETIPGMDPISGFFLKKSVEQLEDDVYSLRQDELKSRVTLPNSKNSHKMFHNIMLCLLLKDIITSKITYGQDDSRWVVGVFNNFYDIFTDKISNKKTDNILIKEFKLYYLLKKYYIDSSFRTFVQMYNAHFSISKFQWNGKTYKSNTFINEVNGGPRYNKDKLAPSLLFPLLVLTNWLNNKPSRHYRKLSKVNKQRFCNAFISKLGIKISLGKFKIPGMDSNEYAPFLNTPQIKLIIANFLQNQDYIYLFSAILSFYIHPSSKFIGFDKLFHLSLKELPFSDIDLLAPRPGEDKKKFKIEYKMLGLLFAKKAIPDDFNNINFSAVDEIYKGFSKKVLHNGHMVPRFIKAIDVLTKKQIIFIKDMSPKFIAYLKKEDMWTDQVESTGFFVKPFKVTKKLSWKKAYKENEPTPSYSGGLRKKYTMKNKRKHNNKSRKLY